MNEIQFQKRLTNFFAFVVWDGATFEIEEVEYSPETEENTPLKPKFSLEIDAFALWMKNGGWHVG